MGFADRDYYRPSGFGGFSFFPPVIKNILIINGIVFFIQILIENIMFNGIPGGFYINKYFALIPFSGIEIGIDQFGSSISMSFLPWQLITYQFLHGDFWHIFMNMFILWMFGMEIENYWGSKKFLFFYLSAGLTGGLLHLIMSGLAPGSALPTIGASGAVYGVMVAFAMFFPDRYIFIYFLLPVKAKYLVVFIMVIEFMSVGDMSFVAHLVHIGGAAFALAFILFDRRHNFNIDRMFSNIKNKINFGDSSSKYNYKGTFRKPLSDDEEVKEAKFYELNNSKSEKEIPQEVIDEILDKISQSGYQKLTEKEKRILFEASKKN